MYQPDYRPSRRISNHEEPAADSEVSTEATTIDLTEMHREHCPYRNATTQHASGSLAGLNASEILHRVAATYARDHRRRSLEQSTRQTEGQDEGSPETVASPAPTLSRAEIEMQDKERESRLRKLKSLFSIKRRSKTVVPAP